MDNRDIRETLDKKHIQRKQDLKFGALILFFCSIAVYIALSIPGEIVKLQEGGPPPVADKLKVDLNNVSSYEMGVEDTDIEETKICFTRLENQVQYQEQVPDIDTAYEVIEGLARCDLTLSQYSASSTPHHYYVECEERGDALGTGVKSKRGFLFRFVVTEE